MNNDKYGYSILFVDNEVGLRENYVSHFRKLFEAVYEADNGEKAYKIYKIKKPDILIIDINISKLNGLELLYMIRKYDPISKAIILTSNEDKDTLLQATSLKLSDYLIKPISKVLLQQSLDKVIYELSNFKTIAIKTQIFNDGYIWNYDCQELRCNGKVIHLTNKEKIVLVLLINNVNNILTKDKIIYTLWNEYIEGHEASLKTILFKLRKKLPKDMIKNIHGIGYKIDS